MSKTILVTGCSGFLGGAIAKWVANSGHRLIACITKPTNNAAAAERTCSIRLPDPKIVQLISQTRPDWVIHCGGASRVGSSFSNPEEDYRASVLATDCLYDTLARFSPTTKVIFLSSAAVYGEPKILPITEKTATAPISPYGQHKLECEGLARKYKETHGLQVSNLRIFSAYGPGLTKQVLWDIFQKSQSGRTVVLQGDGTETRDMIFVNDIVSVVSCLVKNPSIAAHAEMLNVASGTSVAIRELATKFLAALGMRRELHFSGVSLVGAPRYWSVDVGPLRELPIETPRSVDEGLREYAKWLNVSEGENDASRIMVATG